MAVFTNSSLLFVAEHYCAMWITIIPSSTHLSDCPFISGLCFLEMKLPFWFVWRFLRGQVCPFFVAEDLSSEVGVPFYTLTSSSQESWNFSLSGTIVGDNGLTLRHSRGCVVVIHGLHYSFLITKMLKIFLCVYLPSVLCSAVFKVLTCFYIRSFVFLLR